jgi:hypothetical protein
VRPGFDPADVFPTLGGQRDEALRRAKAAQAEEDAAFAAPLNFGSGYANDLPISRLRSEMMTVHRQSRLILTPEALEDLRRRYEDTDEAQTSIADDLEIDRSTLARFARKQGWKLRSQRPPRDLSNAARLARQFDVAGINGAAANASVNRDETSDPATVADRLEAAVEKELREIESLRRELGDARQRSKDGERVARTLATLTETLFKVRRLRQSGLQGGYDDDLPADPDAFRLALAERIAKFVRKWNAEGAYEASEPSDADKAMQAPVERSDPPGT